MSKASQIRQRAQRYLQRGEFNKAVEEYKRLTGIESKNPNLFNELGDIFLRAGDNTQAVASFEKAILNYEKVALYNNAVAVCKKILRVVPNRMNTIFDLGKLRAKQKLEGEAISYFSQFLQQVLSNPSATPKGLEDMVEQMLALVPENEEILTSAANVYEQIGLKSKAAQIFARLVSISRASGSTGRIDLYLSKVESIKSSLSPGDIKQIDKLLASVPETEGGEPTSPSGEGATSREDYDEADVQSVVEETIQEVKLASEAGESIPEETTTQAPEHKPTQDKSPPLQQTPMHEEAPAREQVPVDEEAPARKQAPLHEEAPAREQVPVDEEIPAREQVPVYEQASAREQVPHPSQPPLQGQAPREETSPRDQTPHEPPAPRAPIPPKVDIRHETPPTQRDVSDVNEDVTCVREGAPSAGFSSLLDEDEKLESSGKEVPEEITSDIEKGDYKSHYDLGMAYLEMALYTEAVKEFQYAARSAEYQLKSIEMIGHCFLMQKNPRLAVKQLLRGLEVARERESEEIGLHYNLGLAYEMMGEMERAREHYEEVYIIDVTFREVDAKMKKLSSTS